MKKTIFLLTALVFCLAPLNICAQQTDRPWIYKDMSDTIRFENSLSEVRTGDLELLSTVSAISTTQDSYDIYAPFDGRIEEINVELFDTVESDSVLAQELTTEMAAMLDSTPEVSKNQAKRRWQDVFQPYNILPPERGIVTKVHVTPNTTVFAGDRLFTISKKVLMIGKNTEPIYNPLLSGMTADLEHKRTGDTFIAKLTRFIPIKTKPYYYRLWMEVIDIKKGLRIGEQFDGSLTIAKSLGTKIAKREDIIKHNGKSYLLMEVETGLETEEEIELIRPITTLLKWNYVSKSGEIISREPTKKIEPPQPEPQVQAPVTPSLGTPTVIMDSQVNTKTPVKKTVKKRKASARKKALSGKKKTVKKIPNTPKVNKADPQIVKDTAIPQIGENDSVNPEKPDMSTAPTKIPADEGAKPQTDTGNDLQNDDSQEQDSNVFTSSPDNDVNSEDDTQK